MRHQLRQDDRIGRNDTGKNQRREMMKAAQRRRHPFNKKTIGEQAGNRHQARNHAMS